MRADWTNILASSCIGEEYKRGQYYCSKTRSDTIEMFLLLHALTSLCYLTLAVKNWCRLLHIHCIQAKLESLCQYNYIFQNIASHARNLAYLFSSFFSDLILKQCDWSNGKGKQGNDSHAYNFKRLQLKL